VTYPGGLTPEEELLLSLEELRVINAEVDASTTGIPGTVTATAWPAGNDPPGGTFEWQAAAGPTYYDAHSGVTVYTTPDGSGIVPMFEDPDTHVWSINPAWVAHAEEVGLTVPVVPVAQVPAPDPPVMFGGAGPRPTWGDVYQWATDKAKAEGTLTASSFAPTAPQVQRAIDVSRGTILQAMSGYIDKAMAQINALSWTTKARIDALQVTTFVAVANIGKRLAHLEAIVTDEMRPALHKIAAALATENTNRKAEINQRMAQEAQRVQENVYDPLRADIKAVHEDSLAHVQALHDAIPGMIAAAMPAALAGVTATLAAHAVRLKTLEDIADECSKPMCEYAGPKSPLGKLLQAIKWASLLALLAELGALTADDINNLAAQFGREVASAMVTIDDTFVGGGSTIAHALVSAIGNVA
jgi:hypothetical protein